MQILFLILVFGRFPAELGPETRSNGSGSENGAERTENQPTDKVATLTSGLNRKLKPRLKFWLVLGGFPAKPGPNIPPDGWLPWFRIGNANFIFILVFGRFPAELGPEIRSNGSGSKNGAERTENQSTDKVATLTRGLNQKLKSRLKFWVVLGRFPAKLGPKTPPDGSPRTGWLHLPWFSKGNTHFFFNFGFWQVSGRTRPRDPFQRVGLAKKVQNAQKISPRTGWLHLLAVLIRNSNMHLNFGNGHFALFFGFWRVSGRTWPRDPFQRVGLEKQCRTHRKSAHGQGGYTY
jgi:hypothetical protein